MEEKRRLPSWMVGGGGAVGASTINNINKVSKPLDADTRSVVTSDVVSVVTKSRKPKVEGVITRNHKKEVCISSNKNLLVKCETKRKKGRVVENDVETRKRGRGKWKGEESDLSRKKNKKSYEFNSGDETEGLFCNEDDDDDDDLTMEDVLSIAKEFVENDKSELRSKSPYVRSPVHEETECHHKPVETTSKVTLADSIMTGDPAQDMLDLFLGPLLKKPIAKDESRSSNDIRIPLETKNKQHAAVISNKPVPLAKKKSSLRDAVAMLLD